MENKIENKIGNKISEEKLAREVNRFSRQARKLLADDSKLRGFIGDVRDFLEDWSRIPVLGEAMEDIVAMIDLLADYVDGRYRQVPTKVLISMAACLMYLASPIDLIPDFIPILGFLDDIAVIYFVMNLGVSAELERYRAWKAAQQETLDAAGEQPAEGQTVTAEAEEQPERADDEEAKAADEQPVEPEAVEEASASVTGSEEA